MKPGRRRLLLLLSVAFLLALLPRLWSPSPFITWDEPTWTYRSLKFLTALRAGDAAGTYLTEHPGVVTMWAGALGVAGRLVLSSPEEADLRWVDQLPPFDEDNVALLAQLTPWLPAAKVSIALLTALLVVGIGWLLYRLFDGRMAFLAILLLAFDPFFLAHSRVLHLDAVMAGSMVMAVLGTLAYLRGHGTIYVLLGGALGGLAVLEKSPALFLIPFVGLFVVAWSLYHRGLRLSSVMWASRTLVLWGLAMGLAYFVLWPALWVHPLETLGGMWTYAVESAGKSREAVFFWGRIQPDPGLAFYPLAMLYRLSPLTTLGLVASVPALVRSKRRDRGSLLVVLTYIILFTVFMASGAKKFERYILPAFPALEIVAASGLLWLVDRVSGYRADKISLQPASSHFRPRRLARSLHMLFGALILLQAVFIFSIYHPHYLAYYNPLLGGGTQAARWLPVGWGEGMDLAASYLNAKPEATELSVATPSVTLLAPLYQGQTLRAKEWDTADYVVLYVDDVQIREPAVIDRFYGVQQPEHVVHMYGIDYAWIYPVQPAAIRRSEVHH